MATIEQLNGASVVYEKKRTREGWEINNVWIREVDVEGGRVCASYDRAHYEWFFVNTFRHWKIRYPRIGKNTSG